MIHDIEVKNKAGEIITWQIDDDIPQGVFDEATDKCLKVKPVIEGPKVKFDTDISPHKWIGVISEAATVGDLKVADLPRSSAAKIRAEVAKHYPFGSVVEEFFQSLGGDEAESG